MPEQSVPKLAKERMRGMDFPRIVHELAFANLVAVMVN